jgi:hypothetical protein
MHLNALSLLSTSYLSTFLNLSADLPVPVSPLCQENLGYGIERVKDQPTIAASAAAVLSARIDTWSPAANAVVAAVEHVVATPVIVQATAVAAPVFITVKV